MPLDAPAASPTALAAAPGASSNEPAIRTPTLGAATEPTSTLVLRLRTPSSPLRDLPVVLCAPFVPTEIGLHTHFYRWRVQHTDENGDVRFEGVPRGPIAVRLDDSDDLKPGDRVVISAGPLRNLTGVFERQVKGNDRVLILLTAIGYQGHLEVDRNLIKRTMG